MCGDCWNAAMAAPTAVVAARFAWVGYKDRLPFFGRDRSAAPATDGPEIDRRPAPVDQADELVEAGAPPP